MSGHYPLTLQIFPLTLKHNAMKYKAAPVKDQYDFFFILIQYIVPYFGFFLDLNDCLLLLYLE